MGSVPGLSDEVEDGGSVCLQQTEEKLSHGSKQCSDNEHCFSTHARNELGSLVAALPHLLFPGEMYLNSP